MESETITVLCNACYGGWFVSERACERIHALRKERDPTYALDYAATKHSLLYAKQRHDPILVEVHRELGDEFSGTFSHIVARTIPKCYVNHYTITEYDGMEGIRIDVPKYKLDRIREIVGDAASTSEEKVNQIRAVIQDSATL